METGILKASVHWIAKFDLGLTPSKITNIQRLTRDDKKKQTERGKKLLYHITLANLGKTFFTNEKIFKFQTPNNKQNDKIYGVNLSDIRRKGHPEKSKFLISVIVSTGISKLGKTSIHIVTPGTKMNSASYCFEVLSQLLREMEQLSNGDYIF